MKIELLTIPQFCKATNICRTIVYRLINEGRLKAVKVGKKTLIPQSALEEFVASLPAYTDKNAL